MSEVTVICCWTNEKQYNDFVNTLKAQDCPYELIGIDNRGNKSFTSCAAAYNSVINDVKTKYVIYSHQDILLTDTDTLTKFTAYLGRLDTDDILGVAGVRIDTDDLFTNIKHIWKNAVQYAGSKRVEGEIMECDTVDECFFGGYTEHFRRCKFDEVVCNNWHLYAVDACLYTKYRIGHKVYVCDISLFHVSSGNITASYHWGLFRLCRKYSDVVPVIATTCTRVRTDFMHSFPYFVKYWVRGVGRFWLKRMNLYDKVKKVLH